MPDSNTDLLRSIYAKTAQGQQEIASRSLGLSPLARRVLVLVDGKRSGQELSTFVPGNEVGPQLTELLERGCIEAVATAPAPKPAASVASAETGSHAGHDLDALPAPDSRSAKEADMARNFMINTVNTIFGQHNRISLVESIYASKTTEELRHVYIAWAEAMESNAVGKRRLPELREKLFAVL